jgi:uncharacterized Zn finger protein
MGQGGYIYTFKCNKCGTVWQRHVGSSGVGFGNYTNPCPKCGPAPSTKISEVKAD